MSDRPLSASATIYRIRIQGRLDKKWADWFDGFAMTVRENGETVLTGRVSDQAELFGALVKINNLGLPLLSVMRVEGPCNERNCT